MWTRSLLRRCSIELLRSPMSVERSRHQTPLSQTYPSHRMLNNSRIELFQRLSLCSPKCISYVYSTSTTSCANRYICISTRIYTSFLLQLRLFSFMVSNCKRSLEFSDIHDSSQYPCSQYPTIPIFFQDNSPLLMNFIQSGRRTSYAIDL